MDSANLITIFTPCYNRAHLLSQLYQSLLEQNATNFEWLIVDDGSTDETRKVVESFISEHKIPISYHYKPNGGKHTAINYGVTKAKGALFCIIDSDDFFAKNALDHINKAWKNNRDNNSICGFIGLSTNVSGELVGDGFIQPSWQIPFSDYYLKHNLKGDKSVAFFTSILKNYPFPELEGIKMVFEAVVWHEMSKRYDVLCINEAIQTVNYQDEGVSRSSYKLWYVKSLAFSYFQLIANRTYSFSRYPKTYLWSYIHLASNSLLSGTSYFDKLPTFKDKCLYLILFPRGFYSYLRMKKLVVE